MVHLYDQISSRDLRVQVFGRYTCSVGIGLPDLQLNPKDAIDLFGSSNFAKTQTAYAVIETD